MAAAMEVPLPSGGWKVVGRFSDIERAIEVNNGVLCAGELPDFAGLVVQLARV